MRLRLTTVLAVCLGCCVAGLSAVSVSAFGEEPSPGVVGGPDALSGNPLVVPGAEPLLGDQSAAAEEAKRSNPEAVRAREESESAYEGLGAAAAESVINGVDPVLVNQPAGGPPKLPEGKRVLGYPSDFAMSVVGGDGGREVREALEPVALEMQSGERTPIDLGLSDGGDSFRPAMALAPVRIPKRLDEGAALADAGVSLTPVDEHGVALAGEGVLDGASVFYGDSENANAGVVDVDTLVKPSTFGLLMETSLRSQRSPSRLFFKVGLPEGAALEQGTAGSGPVRVVEDGRALAVVFAPSAYDAEGTPVPVSMIVEGDTLVLMVEHPAGAYAYPIVVDPRTEYEYTEFTWDKQINVGGSHPTNWHFEHQGSLFTVSESSSGMGWTVHVSGSHGEHEFGDMVYTTQGLSHVWDFASQTAQVEKNTRVETLTKVENKSGVEEQHTLSTEVSEPKWNNAVGCRLNEEKCVTGVKPETNNSAVYESVASGVGTGTAGENVFRNAEVGIQQEGNPEVKSDTVDETVNGHPNALHGTKTWLGPHSGALVKVTASDKGIGIEAWKSEHTNASGAWESLSEKSMAGEGLCSGIQCPPEVVEYFGYSSALPDGEPQLGMDAWNAMYDSHAKENEAESLRRYKVKVDSAPPHNIAISGLPSGNEIGGMEYHLKAEAIDGSGTTPSSGIKSLALLIDGKEVGSASGSCEIEKGPCTAHAEWTLAGRDYATGAHLFSIVATDNAGNVATEEITVKVHPAGPVSLGPGALNPQSGEYTLTSADVSMGGGLTVSRSYDSRALTAGAGGPLGAQWGFSLGAQESLVRQPSGSMVLTDASGAQTIFATDGKGGFTAPIGDSNLTLSSTPCEAGQTEYMLSNAATGAATCFKAPSGGSGEVLAPSIVKGVVATDTVTYAYETVEVPGGSGKKITRPVKALAPVPAGVSCAPELKAGCRALTFNYATSTTAKGEAPSEWGDVEGNLTRVYYTAYDPVSKAMKTVEVAKYLYDKQGRLRAEWDPRVSPELKIAYGYDSEGHVTAVSPPGEEPWLISYGTPVGSTSPGHVLSVTRPSAATELGASGAPAVIAESAGNGQLKEPAGVTVDSSGNVWVADTGNSRVQEFSSTGEYIRQFGSKGSGNGQLNLPSGLAFDGKGNVWVADMWNSRVEEFSATGAYIAQFNTTLPVGITVDSSEHIWVTGLTSSKVSEFTTAGTLIRSFGSSGAGNGQFKTPWGIAVDSSGNVWVADHENNRVQKFSSTGTYLAQYIVEKPMGLTIDASGHLWFTRTASIEEMSSTGTLMKTFGSEGTSNGKFKEPKGIAVESSGNVWVADTKNNRMQELTPEMVYLRQFGSGSANSPALSSSAAVVGFTMSVSTGAWSNSPLAYSFQWVRCNSGGGECKPISGATNQTYTPVKEDAEHRLKAEVHASNAAGTGSGTTAGDLVTEFGPLSQFGTEGAGNGQLNKPGDVAVDSKGDVWVADRLNNRVQEFSSTGEYIRQVGPKGSGNGQFNGPRGIAVDGKDDVWVADTGNGRIQELSSTGVYLAQFKVLGTESVSGYPVGIAIDAGEHIWVTNQATAYAPLVEYATTGAMIKSFGSWGTGNGQVQVPWGIAVDPSGNIWVADHGNNRVQKFSSTGTYLTQYGAEGPMGLQVDSSGNLWLTRAASIEEMSSSGTVIKTYGSEGAGSGQFKEPQGITLDASGNAWVADTNNNRVQELGLPTAANETPPTPPNPGTSAVSTVEYNVALSGTGLPNMTASEVEKGWAQKDDPVEATAIFPADETQSWPAHDYKRAAIYYRDAKGRTVNVASPSGAVSTSEYNEHNDVERSLSADNRELALKEGTKSAEVAKLLDTQSKYNGEGTELTETLGPQHAVRFVNGKIKENEEVQARNHSVYTYDEGAPSEGGPYRLVTKVTQGAQVNGEADRDQRTTIKSYGGQEGLGWKLRAPTAITAGPSGLKLTHTTVYEATTGNVIETRAPASTGEGSTHDTKTIYYTSAANAGYPACGEHPQWANLPCETLPGKQPEVPLPVTTIAYNMWGEPATTTQTVGAATRTTTSTYDAAGRALTSEATSSEGKALPKVTEKYSEATGRLLEQSTTTGGETKTITNKYNALGQLIKYTDADGNTTEYEYEPEKDDRLIHVNDGKGTQTYTYEETTGALSKLVDTQGANVLTFTASHDVEGNMTSEGYPNGMTAGYTRNPAGETTGLTYEKTTHCSEKCVWFTESAIPSIHDQTLEQVSSLAKKGNTYDEAGRLTQVQEIPTGEGCTTRLYEYDKETNRKKLTTRAPGTGGACATEGGTAQTHTYDGANRLIDTGTTRDTFGDTTKLPASDAGGTELSSSFYVDGQLEGQTQNGQTIAYQLDPSGRTRQTVDTGTVSSTTINHYTDPGSAPSWTAEPVSGHWSRDVSGISGFAAIETDTAAPVLQLPDLQGNIIATASTSETATKLLGTERFTEYGTPTVTKPAKYSWLGGALLPTELSSGVVAMGARSYVPQVGSFLQADPLPGGSANAYSYTNGDPVNETDLTGEYVENNYVLGLSVEQNGQAIALEAAREAAARAEAERKAEEAAWAAAASAKMAAELAEAEARNAWNAEAAAGPPGAIPGGGMAGYAGPARFENLMDCAGGCHVTPQQEKCLKKAGSNKSRGSKCFPPKGGSPTPVEKCILGAGGAILVSWIPGLDLDSAEAAAAGCGAALGSPGTEIGKRK